MLNDIFHDLSPSSPHLVAPIAPKEDAPIASPGGHHLCGGLVAGAVHETHVPVLAGLHGLQQRMVTFQTNQKTWWRRDWAVWIK